MTTQQLWTPRIQIQRIWFVRIRTDDSWFYPYTKDYHDRDFDSDNYWYSTLANESSSTDSGESFISMDAVVSCTMDADFAEDSMDYTSDNCGVCITT